MIWQGKRGDPFFTPPTRHFGHGGGGGGGGGGEVKIYMWRMVVRREVSQPMVVQRMVVYGNIV